MATRKQVSLANTGVASRAAQVVAVFLDGTAKVADHEARIVGEKRSILDGIRMALNGVDAVSLEDWTSYWQKPVLDALVASGRYQKQVRDNGVVHYPSANTTIYQFRNAVIALTNGVSILDTDTSLKAFSDRAGDVLNKRGLVVKSAKGSKKGVAKTTSKASKGVSASKEGFNADSALAMLAGDDKTLRTALAFALEHVKAFKAWAASMASDD